jgi:predicted O-linked N-acetylglucosamine transferase (SPINDLY family)
VACSDMTVEQIARRIHSDEVDILIDLNGFIQGTRSVPISRARS